VTDEKDGVDQEDMEEDFHSDEDTCDIGNITAYKRYWNTRRESKQEQARRHRIVSSFHIIINYYYTLFNISFHVK